MPFRTRDFVLFSLLVAFLLIGIGSTISQSLSTSNKASAISFGDSVAETASHKATLPDKTDERSSRLSNLKAKVAAFLENNNDLTLQDEELGVNESTAKEDKDNGSKTTAGSILLCTNYTTKNISWTHNNLKFEIIEGARILYRDTTEVATDTGSTIREVVMQLPLRTFPLDFETCLKNDIIGIAMDGSLIRNNDYSIYKIFGPETLVGYALDGFPIYGLNETIKTDSCGGAISGGDYKYFISSDREGVVGCFSATPISI